MLPLPRAPLPLHPRRQVRVSGLRMEISLTGGQGPHFEAARQGCASEVVRRNGVDPLMGQVWWIAKNACDSSKHPKVKRPIFLTLRLTIKLNLLV